jgi:hypothetical protein
VRELPFAPFARCGLFVLGVLLLSACAKKADPPPPAPEQPAPQQPKPKPPRTGPGAGGPSAGAPNIDPFGGLLGVGGPSPAEAQVLKKKYEALLLGTWVADLGDGFSEERTYNPDGTYAAKLTGPTPATASGKYAIVQSVGTRALKLRLGDDPGAKTITVSFQGDELEHPSLRPGVTGTFRKK